jgi:hypothetical protein
MLEFKLQTPVNLPDRKHTTKLNLPCERHGVIQGNTGAIKKLFLYSAQHGGELSLQI